MLSLAGPRRLTTGCLARIPVFVGWWDSPKRSSQPPLAVHPAKHRNACISKTMLQNPVSCRRRMVSTAWRLGCYEARTSTLSQDDDNSSISIAVFIGVRPSETMKHLSAISCKSVCDRCLLIRIRDVWRFSPRGPGPGPGRKARERLQILNKPRKPWSSITDLFEGFWSVVKHC